MLLPSLRSEFRWPPPAELGVGGRGVVHILSGTPWFGRQGGTLRETYNKVADRKRSKLVGVGD